MTVHQFKPRGHRTREEIIAQLEARYAEMKAEARREADPKINFPCEGCRHYSRRGDDGFDWSRNYPEYATCHHPLVKGFREHGVQISGYGHQKLIGLCGPEKALWEPRRNALQRLVDWFVAPWRQAA